MSKKCECEVVKKYDDVYQCMICRKNFIATESVNDQFVKWLDDRTAHVSVTGNIMIIVMKLGNEEIDLYEDMVDELTEKKARSYGYSSEENPKQGIN